MAGVKGLKEDSAGASGPLGALVKQVMFEPLRIGPVSTLEEIEVQVLRFKIHKLKQRLDLRQKQESDLRERIEQLEKRQTQDNTVLNVMNQYWNNLNEDIRILLERFDAETSDEFETKNENKATTSFLTQLSTWDADELDEKMLNRVQVSTRAVAKIIQAFDRLVQRTEKVTKALEEGARKGTDSEPRPLDEAARVNIELQVQNRQVQAGNTSLHENYHKISLKMKELQEKLTAKETKSDELQNRVDDLNWEVSKLMSQGERLMNHVHDLSDKYKKLQQLVGASSASTSSGVELTNRKVELSEGEVNNLKMDNNELRELAENRLAELETLQRAHKETLHEVAKLKKEIRNLPESHIMETTEFKCLQSMFSVSYSYNLQLRSTLEETKQHIKTMETNHEVQLKEIVEQDKPTEKKFKDELKKREERLIEVRKEYEALQMEFAENVSLNEQTVPISREMRHLIMSLQYHNQQLKGEAHKFRKHTVEAFTENAYLKMRRDELEAQIASALGLERLASSYSYIGGYKEEKEVATSTSLEPKNEPRNSEVKKCDVASKSSEEVDTSNNTSSSKGDISLSPGEISVKKEPKKELVPAKPSVKRSAAVFKTKSESESVKELRSQLKKALNDQREMKLLLSMYKGASKEQQEKVQLMASERRSRLELDEIKQTIKKLQDQRKNKDRKKLADEDSLKRIKSLEEQVNSLQKQITAQKQEEDALISEMTMTGQAFEDMQEQNSRLIQQLREKDDANFKLMTERIKATHLQRLAKEEGLLLQQKAETLTKQLEFQNEVVAKLEEKEGDLLNVISSMEKQAGLCVQAMELYKRKAIESAQCGGDLKLHLEKYHLQMKDAQQTVAEKTSALETEAYKTKRLQEEIIQLRRKMDRLSKIEMAVNTDEVMMEEIREYKKTLTCSSCKLNRTDAVLIKCFHVFCFDCLRTRYETRQRKCPKCNAAFGANDYHRLYLS